MLFSYTYACTSRTHKGSPRNVDSLKEIRFQSLILYVFLHKPPSCWNQVLWVACPYNAKSCGLEGVSWADFFVKFEACINEMLWNMLRRCEFIELKWSRVLCSLVSMARMFLRLPFFFKLCERKLMSKK